MQVMEDVPDAILFSHYNYASSTVAGLVRHFEHYADFLSTRYSRTDPLVFMEIGCNDGVLLNRLPPAWQLIGVDPSDVARKALTVTSRYRLFNAPFTVSLVKDNHLENSIDVFSGSNCLAHISDLKEVFTAVAMALRVGGHFWIEVHDLESLLRGSQWDTIYHEHKVEWSEQSLVHCLAPLGFSHLVTFHLPLHGGLLRVGFRKEDRPVSLTHDINKLETDLSALRSAYKQRYETPAAQTLLQASNSGHPIAAYGAAGRANVYLNQLQLLPFSYIVDESPQRLNKFLPHVGTPIVPPHYLETQPVGHCLITAWNYREDIIRKNHQYKGQWLTAFEEQ